MAVSYSGDITPTPLSPRGAAARSSSKGWRDTSLGVCRHASVSLWGWPGKDPLAAVFGWGSVYRFLAPHLPALVLPEPLCSLAKCLSAAKTHVSVRTGGCKVLSPVLTVQVRGFAWNYPENNQMNYMKMILEGYLSLFTAEPQPGQPRPSKQQDKPSCNKVRKNGSGALPISISWVYR